MITIFIPVYNEESILSDNYKQLTAWLETRNLSFEIIIGSNGSTDRTVAILKEMARNDDRLMWFHIEQCGVGLAFKRALEMARGSSMFSIDMDLSIDLSFISDASVYLDQKFDMIIGSKIMGDQKRSFLRRFGSASYIFLSQLLLGLSYSDYSIGAKAYRVAAIQPFKDSIDDHTAYVQNSLYEARDLLKVKEISVECDDRRSSHFCLWREGLYRFGHLFRLKLTASK